MVNKEGLSGFSNRKGAKYFVVRYKIREGLSKFVLNQQFRIKSKNKKNAVLQLRKQINEFNKGFFKDKDKHKIIKIISVIRTDSFFKRIN